MKIETKYEIGMTVKFYDPDCRRHMVGTIDNIEVEIDRKGKIEIGYCIYEDGDWMNPHFVEEKRIKEVLR